LFAQRGSALALLGVSLLCAPLLLAAPQAGENAQTAVAPSAAAGRGGPRRGAANSAYPTRVAADPAVIARGQQIFSANCSFCHGSDAAGGEGGPNLIVSQLVLDDQHGELIVPVVRGGRADKGMPKFDLSADDIKAIAEFVHSFPTRGGGPGGGTIVRPTNPVVGDAKAGEAYFNGAGKCASCHSVSGDLAGIGSKLDPRTLQGAILSGGVGGGRGPGGGANAGAANTPGRTVTVTLPSGEKVEGKLARIDFFFVSLTDAKGNYRSFDIENGSPRVEVHDPLQAHKDKLPSWQDSDIHNLTAYLVTLK